MQENNFEKEVQQKMEDLKINPGGEVWQKLSVAIATRKTDRRIFGIVLLLLIIGCSILFLNNDVEIKNIKAVSEKDDRVAISTIMPPTNDIDSNRKMPEAISVNTGSKAGDKPGVVKKVDTPKKDGYPQTSGAGNLVTLNEPYKPGNVNDQITTGDKDKVTNSTNEVRRETSQKVALLTNDNEPVDLNREINKTGDSNKIIIDDRTREAKDVEIQTRLTGAIAKDEVDIKGKSLSDTTAASAVDVKKAPSVKKSMLSKQKNKWKVGVNFSLGVTTTRNSYLGIIGSGSSDESKAYDNLNQSTGGTGAVTYSHTPSKIKAGTGLIVGMFAQKNIFMKTNLLLGLNYKRYSSGMLTGMRIDSTGNFNQANSFYRSGNGNSFKNHFHFIELPAALRVNLSGQRKTPFYLNLGVSVSRLIGSNALQFDTLSGIYYNNNAVFNKTQLNVSAGLLFSLPGSSKNPILIGPDINFSLNKMANSGLYKKRHYSYFGMVVQKALSK